MEKHFDTDRALITTWHLKLWRFVKDDDLPNVTEVLEVVKARSDDLPLFVDRKEWMMHADPLHCAAWFGRDRALALMVDAGLDVNGHTLSGAAARKTCLHLAVEATNESTIRVLLEKGARFEVKSYCDGGFYGNPLDFARQEGKPDCIVRVLRGDSFIVLCIRLAV